MAIVLNTTVWLSLFSEINQKRS